MTLSKVLTAVAIASAFVVSTQAQSLGDQAREMRAEKTPAPQSKVYTNDNLPTGGGITVIGAAPAPAASSTVATASAATPTKGAAVAPAANSAADDQKAADKLKDDVQAQKDEISRLERELDVATREWKLQQATYYADAGNQLRDPAAFAERERKFNDQTKQKQQAIADAKQKLDDMQEQARKSGLPSSAVE
jgi:hypothetical protein